MSKTSFNAVCHQGCLNVLLRSLKDLARTNAAYTTVPHSLHQGLVKFAKASFLKTQSPIVYPSQKRTKTFKAGTYLRPYNRTMTMNGEVPNQNEFINYDVFGAHETNKAYEAMGMQHFPSNTIRLHPKPGGPIAKPLLSHSPSTWMGEVWNHYFCRQPIEQKSIPPENLWIDK